MKEYGLYDLKDNEQCVYIGTIKEMAIFLNTTVNCLRSYMSHRKRGDITNLLLKKYELIEIKEDEVENPIKTDKEIFNEIIKAFTGQVEIATLKQEIAKFEVFDEFKWMLKGRLNQIREFEEEWKQIPGFEYSISNYGHIRNDKNGKLKSLRYHRWIIQVDIYKDGKRYTIDVTRMEASLFIRRLEKTERVSFIDGDRRNMFYKNLKIVSK